MMDPEYLLQLEREFGKDRAQTFLSSLAFIEQNPDIEQRYQQYAKAASDYTTAMVSAERKGFEIGIQKGRRKGALENARNCKAMGLPVEKIAEATGLTIEEVQKL
jgi:predicted transposase/invertase (TIGR01784 family)